MAGAGDVFDVCVIGAGVEGSSTARYLASRGKKALLLEQVRVNFTTVHNNWFYNRLSFLVLNLNFAEQPQSAEEIAKQQTSDSLFPCG